MRNLFAPITKDGVSTAFVCDNGLRGVWDCINIRCNDTEGIERLSIEPIVSSLDAVPWDKGDGAVFTVYAHYKDGSINEVGVCNFFECPYEVERSKDIAAIARKTLHKHVQTAIIWAATCGVNIAIATACAANGLWVNCGFSCVMVLACFWWCRFSYKKVATDIRLIEDWAQVSATSEFIRQQLNLLSKNGKEF